MLMKSEKYQSFQRLYFSCHIVPIFKSIPIDNVVINILHLFLCISDVLICLLIQDLHRLDGIAKSTLDIEKHHNVVLCETFLNTAKYTSDNTHHRKQSGGTSLILKNTTLRVWLISTCAYHSRW